MSKIGDIDIHLFNEGTHRELYDCMGAHLTSEHGESGTRFTVWAPNAEKVAIVGDWNGWTDSDLLEPVASSGIWSVFVAGVAQGAHYKYRIWSKERGYRADKADPYGVHHETPPHTASIVWSLDGYQWGDAQWMRERGGRQAQSAPISIYELHLGSWSREHRTYRDIAPALADHVSKLGFTHVELMPVMEHPFGGSWGYQVTGYFAPTSRFGTPQDFMYLIDHLHQKGIGVILDWVPAHFPTDEHGLNYFDGTNLYEHADPRQGFHPDWKSSIFNYGRHEVKSFLLSSARFWLDKYHADGLRVDGVASMLYLDYSRKAGEWIPNEQGGRENLAAIRLLREMNEMVYRDYPDIQTYAEESTAWPMVSRPTYLGGLGFGFKWDMGWMHDTLEYFSNEAIHRKYHHDRLTFRSLYAWQENFVMPLSHDEVVHGKRSLVDKMPGDMWQKRANLRLLYAYMYAQPGKKLLFMGAELAQWQEWNHDGGLDFGLESDEGHGGVMRCLAHLNRTYRGERALHELDVKPEGFAWVDARDIEQSVLCFERLGSDREPVLCVFNFTPVPRHNYRVGVSREGVWQELVNTDASEYGGSGVGNMGACESTIVRAHGRSASLLLTLPPLAALYLKRVSG